MVDDINALCVEVSFQGSALCTNLLQLGEFYQKAPVESKTASLVERTVSECVWKRSLLSMTYKSGFERDMLHAVTSVFSEVCSHDDWSFVRVGPMNTNSQWHWISLSNATLHVSTMSMVKRLLAPVDAQGILIGNPPIHLHHSLHLIENAFPSNGNPTSGDEMICFPNKKACMADDYPLGYGQLIDSPVTAQVLLHTPSDTLHNFYCLFAYEMKRDARPLGFYHVLQPPTDNLPALSFLAPASKWFKWFTWKWTDSGMMVHARIHSHWSLGTSQSMIFSGGPEHLGLAGIKLNEHGVYEHNSSRRTLLRRLMSNMNSQPGQVHRPLCMQQSDGYILLASGKYDRRPVFSCVTPFNFSAEESVTSITFADNSHTLPTAQHIHYYFFFFPMNIAAHPDQYLLGRDRRSWRLSDIGVIPTRALRNVL